MKVRAHVYLLRGVTFRAIAMTLTKEVETDVDLRTCGLFEIGGVKFCESVFQFATNKLAIAEQEFCEAGLLGASGCESIPEFIKCGKWTVSELYCRMSP